MFVLGGLYLLIFLCIFFSFYFFFFFIVVRSLDLSLSHSLTRSFSLLFPFILFYFFGVLASTVLYSVIHTHRVVYIGMFNAIVVQQHQAKLYRLLSVGHGAIQTFLSIYYIFFSSFFFPLSRSLGFVKKKDTHILPF